MKNVISRLLKKNISAARIIGFVISNFVGLAIIVCSIQFYEDARGLWTAEDGFMQSDYLVINKKVSGANTWDGSVTVFNEEEVNDIRKQSWVRSVGEFSASDYRVWAQVGHGGTGMSTMLFFESIPDEYVDVAVSDWGFHPGSDYVPIVISKDYLALYNFGFAGSAGLPQMSETLMSGIPLQLILSSDDGSKSVKLNGRVVGYSNRLNTILVPQSFMEWSNDSLGTNEHLKKTSRVIVNVSSPGDIAIKDYLNDHNFEVAGDKSGSSASFFLRLVIGIVLGIGCVITVLSFFILMLSMSLILEKNRDKIHQLLQLGCPLAKISSFYDNIIIIACSASYLLACGCMLSVRSTYRSALTGLGGEIGDLYTGISIGFGVTLVIILANIWSVKRSIRQAWSINRC